jgi:hypothetical protein
MKIRFGMQDAGYVAHDPLIGPDTGSERTPIQWFNGFLFIICTFALKY